MDFAKILSETNHLTPSEFGALARILMTIEAHAPISSDPERMRLIAQVDPADWPNVWSVINHFVISPV